MSFKKFEKKDILRNVIETHPQVRFDIYDSKLYYNERSHLSGAFSEEVRNVPSGFVSLYELNVDKSSGKNDFAYPFVQKSSDLVKFKSITKAKFAAMEYGEILTGSYPLSASITRNVLTSSADSKFSALKNTIDYYSMMGSHYSNVSNFTFASASLISIPSIFYGSSIEKGSIDLKFYVSGTLVGQLKDENKNGALIESVGPRSGSEAGIALYNEGFLILSGNYSLSPHTENYDGVRNPRWVDYAKGANDGTPSGTIPSSSYSMQLNGTNYVPTFTMFAHAEIGEFNHSNNPTYIEYGQNKQTLSGAYVYEEPKNLLIKNTVSSSYSDPTGSFDKVTYISKVGIYDKDKNLIGIATTATPIKKTQNRNLTFKLKLDI